jgi:hypothetical protein
MGLNGTIAFKNNGGYKIPLTSKSSIQNPCNACTLSTDIGWFGREGADFLGSQARARTLLQYSELGTSTKDGSRIPPSWEEIIPNT